MIGWHDFLPVMRIMKILYAASQTGKPKEPAKWWRFYRVPGCLEEPVAGYTDQDEPYNDKPDHNANEDGNAAVLFHEQGGETED